MENLDPLKLTHLSFAREFLHGHINSVCVCVLGGGIMLESDQCTASSMPRSKLGGVAGDPLGLLHWSTQPTKHRPLLQG